MGDQGGIQSVLMPAEMFWMGKQVGQGVLELPGLMVILHSAR